MSGRSAPMVYRGLRRCLTAAAATPRPQLQALRSFSSLASTSPGAPDFGIVVPPKPLPADESGVLMPDNISSYTRPWAGNPPTSICNQLKLAGCGYHLDPPKHILKRLSAFEIAMNEELGDRRSSVPRLKPEVVRNNFLIATALTLFCLATYRYVAVQSSGGGGTDGLEQLASVFRELKANQYDQDVKMLDELERLEKLQQLEAEAAEPPAKRK